MKHLNINKIKIKKINMLMFSCSRLIFINIYLVQRDFAKTFEK